MHRVAPGRAIAGGRGLQQVGQGRIGVGEMLGDALEMQIGAVVEDGAAGSDADGAAEVAHQVEQAARGAQAVRRKHAERQRHDWGHAELLREAAEGLRHQQLLPAPIVRDRGEQPHRHAEAGEPKHHQPAQVDTIGDHPVDRHRQQLEHAGRKERGADLKGVEAAHPAEEQRRQVDRAEDADPGDEREPAAQREIADRERTQVDHRSGESEAAQDEADAGKAGDPGADPDRIIAEPVPARTFLEHIFETAQEQRHQHDAEVVGALEQREVRLVDADQDRHQDGHRHARHHIHVEQPMPGPGIGDPSAHHGA